MITIIFFAALREQLGCDQLELTLPDESISIEQLKSLLAARDETWHKAFANPLMLSAINHNMVQSNSVIKSGDEVAFFPPVTGG